MSTYQPPRHILLRRHTDAITDRDLAYLERALAEQLREAAAAYGLEPPGVTLVTEDTHLPTDEAVGIDFVDDDGLPDGVAHHGWNQRANFAWSLIGCREAERWTVAASHEALEYLVNLRLDQWVDDPDGRWPKEICDAVEADSYEITVELFGAKRAIAVSNYVLPAWWSLGMPGPYDRMSRVLVPFGLTFGGYALVERNGVLVDLDRGSTRHGPSAPARATSRVDEIRRMSRIIVE